MAPKVTPSIGRVLAGNWIGVSLGVDKSWRRMVGESLGPRGMKAALLLIVVELVDDRGLNEGCRLLVEEIHSPLQS